MSIQLWPNPNDMVAKPFPLLLHSQHIWHQLAQAVFLSSSKLSSSYRTKNTSRLYYKGQTTDDFYETIRSYWYNISGHKNILGGNVLAGRKIGPSCLCPTQAYGENSGVVNLILSISTRWRWGVHFTPRLHLPQERKTGPIEREIGWARKECVVVSGNRIIQCSGRDSKLRTSSLKLIHYTVYTVNDEYYCAGYLYCHGVLIMLLIMRKFCYIVDTFSSI
jgi:hypothetical protein